MINNPSEINLYQLIILLKSTFNKIFSNIKSTKMQIQKLGIFIGVFIFLNSLTNLSLLGQETGVFTDSRDNKQYKTVKIGDQEWMAENLSVTHFRNGDIIDEVKTHKGWMIAASLNQPAWCYYYNDPDNEEEYGRLYNWYAINDPRGLAPEGWKIPSFIEWEKYLTEAIGEKSGNELKSTEGWDLNGNGNNQTGFSALPAGVREPDGSFDRIGKYALWWSNEQHISHETNAWYIYLSYDSDLINEEWGSKTCGMSVRCVKK
jgi:uncharacterized protein (TIGR02145 family)